MSRPASPAPRSTRRFFFLALAVIAAIGLYTAGWFYIAGRLEAQTRLAMERQAARGIEAECASPQAHGYPFRIGLICESTAWREPAGGIAISAGALRSAAQVYAPRHVVGEIDGPAELDLPGLVPLRADWQSLQASVRASEPLPSRASLQATDARLSVRSSHAPVIATADAVQAHMRTVEGSLDLAAALTGVNLPEGMTNGVDLPPLALTSDMTIRDGALHMAAGKRSLRGLEGTLRDLSLDIGGSAGARLTGPFSVDGEGRLNGDFSLTLLNPAELAALAKRLYPREEKTIGSALAALTALGGGNGSPVIPVRVSDGVPSLGFFRLQPLPRLP